MPSTCRYCKSELKPTAVFCTDCKSFQDWRRFFSLGSSTLSLLIALISVTTVFYSTARGYFFYTEDVRAIGSDRALTIVNLSEKPIFLSNSIWIEQEAEQIDGEIQGGTLLLPANSHSTFQIRELRLRRSQAGIVLKSLNVDPPRSSATACSFVIQYMIGGGKRIERTPCSVEYLEVK